MAALLLTAGLCAVSAAWGAPVLAPDHVSLKTLDNGLRLVVKEERAEPVVALALYVRAGTLYEPEGQAGVAALVQRLVFGHMGGDEGFAAQVEAMGGEAAVATTRDFVEVTATVAPESARPWSASSWGTRWRSAIWTFSSSE